MPFINWITWEAHVRDDTFEPVERECGEKGDEEKKLYATDETYQ